MSGNGGWRRVESLLRLLGRLRLSGRDLRCALGWVGGSALLIGEDWRRGLIGLGRSGLLQVTGRGRCLTRRGLIEGAPLMRRLVLRHGKPRHGHQGNGKSCNN
jgi:hypothetical protein